MTIGSENNLGIITIDNDVFARLAGLSAMECYGIVGMAAKSVKDGLVRLLKIETLTKGVKVRSEGEDIIIDLYIIVEYGTNIVAVSETLISTVKYRILENTGIELKKVNVFVEGIRIEK